MDVAESYTNLFDNILDACALHEIICDERGRPIDYRFLAVNPAFERIVGLDSSAVVGKRALDVFPGTEHYWIDAFGDVALTGKPFQLEQYSRELGRFVRVSAYQTLPGQFACLLEDISERKRSERHLCLQAEIMAIYLTATDEDAYVRVLSTLKKTLDSEFGYFGYIDDNGDLVCPTMTRDIWRECEIPNKEIVFPRSAWSGIWGQSLVQQATLLSNGPLNLPAGHVQIQKALASAIVYRGNLIGQIALARRENDYLEAEREQLIDVTNMIAPILASRRESSRHDHERQRVLEELSESRIAAEAANRAKSAFLATMSHEIRTPLNGVQGFLQLLGMCDLDPEAAEYVDSAMDSSQSLLTLINDILDFSKIEAGKFSIECEPFAVDALVRSVVNTFSPKVASKGITLNAAIDPGVDALVVGDEARLRQVLFNLIGNAVKFTDHGEVRLDIRALESIDGERIRLQFTVMDTGVGISADNIPDLFEPFTQADSSLRRRFQGSGLGLAIVKRLVSLMGGQVAIDSALGHGTTVRFDIVVGICAEDGPTDNKPVLADHQAGESQGKLLRALVVDDEPINANLLCRILEKLGHSPETACNGRQALEMLSAQRFDVVFMDVSMPEMDGIKATRLIRENQNGDLDASIPIIAMTAHAMEGDREKCLAAGMDRYLSKPIDTKALHRVLDCFMEGEARCNPTE